MISEAIPTLYTADVSKLTETIKRDRAMLRHGSSTAWLYYHREFPGFEHEDSHQCLCSPVRIGNTEWRESEYFAKRILKPAVH